MSSLSKKALSLMSGLLKMNYAERLTGEQALKHPWFDDIRNPEDDHALLNMIATIQRPIYSSQSRITSYGQQKFNMQQQPMQNPLMQQNTQKPNGSVSHSKEKISGLHKQPAQSFASGSVKMTMTNGMTGFSLTKKNFSN